MSHPYDATEANVQKLNTFLIKAFPTVSNKSSCHVSLSILIHLKPDAKPYAVHTPMPVPLHCKEEVNVNLDKDIKDGIMEPVPIGEVVSWCSPMVVAPKKDGRPRRTVDLQKLDAQCLRETHHCPSPFKLACQVLPNTKKTVVDATDGYYSVPLNEDNKPLTTFITKEVRTSLL